MKGILKHLQIFGGSILSKFREFDQSGDMLLQRQELKAALFKIGVDDVTEKTLNAYFVIFDKNNNGEISYDEFGKVFQ